LAVIALIAPAPKGTDSALACALSALGFDPRTLGAVDPSLRSALLRLPGDWQAAYARETLKARATDLRRFADWARDAGEAVLASRDRLADLASMALTDLSQSLGQQSFCRLASHLAAFLKALGLSDAALVHRRRMAVRTANRSARARLGSFDTRGRKTWLSAAEISKISAQIECSPLPPLARVRDQAIFALMCELLLRRSEVGDLRLVDWDPPARCLTLRHGKTDQMGRGTSYQLTEKTALRLETWLEQLGLGATSAPAERARTPIFVPLHKSGCIRRRGDGRVPALTGASVARLLKSHAEATGIAGVCGHTPRRSVARLMERAGYSDAEICKAGRWESAEVMRGYVGLIEMRRGAGACLEEMGL